MKKTVILLCAVVVLAIIPFLMSHNSNAEFGGSDDQAEGVIDQMDPGYKPWFSPVFEPASGEVESLLFTLQGSIGTGIIFYILGYYRGRSRHEEVKESAQVAHAHH